MRFSLKYLPVLFALLSVPTTDMAAGRTFPIDVPPILGDGDIPFTAELGITYTKTLTYYSESSAANVNTFKFSVLEPVNIAFRFYSYSCIEDSGPIHSSGVKQVNMTLRQTYSFDGEPLETRQLPLLCNTATNVLMPERDTLFNLMPGEYQFVFKGLDRGDFIPNSVSTQAQLQSIVVPVTHHLVSVDMTALATEEIPVQLTYPEIMPPASGQPADMYGTPSKNYVVSFSSSDGGTSQGIASVEYYDGLGRKEETVVRGVTPLGKDLATYQEYDQYGRESRLWLPAVLDTSQGSYAPANQCMSASEQINNGDSEPYSYPVYETSPLNRVTEMNGAGQSWHLTEKNVRTEYHVNQAGNSIMNCSKYTASDSGTADMTIEYHGNYDTGSLQVTKTTDEDGHVSLDFKDAQDRTVLKRSITENGMADTYYIYDGLGRLCAVLPPELVAQAGGSSVSSDLVDLYGYLYKYNDHELLSAKKLPGSGWTTYEYDQNDRLAYSQDASQRQRNEKTFYLYDIFGRECIRGTGTVEILFPGGTIGQPVLPVRDPVEPPSVWNPVSQSPSASGTCSFTGKPILWMGYENCYVNLQNIRITNVSFYDNYQFLSLIPPSLPNAPLLYGTEPVNAMGLLTGTASLRLQKGLSGIYDYSVVRYDERNRVIHTESTNLLDGYDVEDTELDFLGQPTKRFLRHHVSGQNDITQFYTYDYDHANRLTQVTHSLNGGDEVVLACNTYDELGRLASTTRNGNSQLTTEYEYNIRGWTTKIDGPLFSEDLYYNTSHNSSTPQWGGNVSAMDWKAGSTLLRGYTFGYDALSRLTSADYVDDGMGDGHYSTEYTYDKMGNIQTLKRHGLQDNNQYDLIDDLSFSYNGNQVTKVDDAVSGPYYNGAFHFVDGADADVEYEYDPNGNMTKDLNKNISSIQYNSLNLPSRITYSDGRMAEYVYSAAGAKLSTTYTNGLTTTGNVYCGNMIYENGTLKQILVDGGYITFNGTTPTYHFYLKDHLGNNRVVASGDGTIEQVDHYYPYGGLMGESTGGDHQRYKYNGKELDRMHGLDWYDYGARHMDGMRFTTIDPLSEKYYNISPYAYCGNNPIRFVDPDGKKIVLGSNCSPEFVMHYDAAIAYLKEHNAAHVWYQLDGREEIITLFENAGVKNYASGNNVFWNPLSGLCTDAGGEGHKLSPAIRLLHELGHKLQEFSGEYNIENDNTVWQSKEEKRNILEVETPAAIACGEIPENTISRDSHSGIPFKTESSTSTKIINPEDPQVKMWRMCWEE